jgi:tetratricopeptide (TPR) repeat protein
MDLPPDALPEGLSAEAYRKLGLRYGLMGKAYEAAEAMQRAAIAKAADLKASGDQSSGEQSFDQEPGEEKTPDFKTTGAQVGMTVMSLLIKALNQDSESSGEDPFEKLRSQLKAQMRALNMTEEQVDQQLETIKRSLDQIRQAGLEPPPREVPTGLSSEQYFELGKRYKDVGWTEQSRDALQFAIDACPDGLTAVLAQRYLRTRLPRRPVPLMAEKQNIDGYNEMARGDLWKAEKSFKSLNHTYPDFEWPYSNLGLLYIQQGKLSDAIKALEEALAINPYYVNAWLHKARALALLSDLNGAYDCLDKASAADPDERAVASLRGLLDQLKE